MGIFSSIFNVSSNELCRTVILFAIRFFHRFGFVIGWTVITALIVNNYGIEYLPYLFLANGIFIIASGALYSKLVEKIRNTNLIYLTVATAVLMIVLGTFMATKSLPLLLLILIFAESFLLYQLNILIAAFIERFFTPLSSQRTFPLIESAETLSVLLAGLLMMFLSEGISPLKFFYIWAVAVSMIIPLTLYGNAKYNGRIEEEENPHEFKKGGFMRILIDDIGRARGNKFLGTLVFIVLFQCVFVTLMEFQYTKAVSASVLGGIPHSVSGNDHALIHALGSLQVLFGSSALLMQILIGSRIITSLGIVASMLLYPIVGFLSLSGLITNFSYLTGVLAKNNTEISNVIFKNAYHSAFYAISNKVREISREFLEGFVRPFSALISMSVILGLQVVFEGDLLKLSVNMLLFFITLVMMIYVFKARKAYTATSAKLLFSENSTLIDKYHAIEILAQKGHYHSYLIFSKALKSKEVPEEAKNHIVELLGHSGRIELLSMLSEKDDNISEKIKRFLKTIHD